MKWMTCGTRLELTPLQAKKLVAHSMFEQTKVRMTDVEINNIIHNIRYNRDAHLLWTGAKLVYSIVGFMVYGYAADNKDVAIVQQWIKARR